MMYALRTGLVALCVSLAGCAAGIGDSTTAAPQPSKPIDEARFFTGTWYEIARTPMKLTDGCVAGTTDYLTGSSGELVDRDACRMDTPAGKEKAIAGAVSILNPGENNKVIVRYMLFGILPLPRTYWMVDHGDDYQWFIEANPAFTQISIFTRSPRPGQTLIAALTARAQALGYDTKKLEYPAEFPAS